MQTTPSAEPLKSAAQFPFLAAVVGFALFAAAITYFFWTCDDAYISLRYSQNFANGHGLVYNVGERVEGYSNLIWVLWGALLEKLGLNWGTSPASYLGVTSVVFSLALFGLILRKLWERTGSTASIWIAALFLATFPPLAVWSSSGLETALFALLIFALYCELSAPRFRPLRLLLLTALTLVTRTDGWLWCAILAIAFTWAGRSELNAAGLHSPGNEKRPIGRIATLLGGTLLVFGLLALFRWNYYGDWLPQTVRAKGSLTAETLERGRNYVLIYLLHFLSVPLLLLLAIPMSLKNKPQLRVPVLIVLGNTAYCILCGGDFMTMGRFFVPSIPFLAWIAAQIWLPKPSSQAESTSESEAAASPAQASLGLAGALTWSVLLAALSIPAGFRDPLIPTDLLEGINFRWNSERYRTEFTIWQQMQGRPEPYGEVGYAISRLTPPDSSLVAGAIGSMGYHSERFIYDQNGLVTRSPVTRGERRFRRSPGHDYFVDREFFRDQGPTYVGCNLVNLTTDKFVIGERWLGGIPDQNQDRFAIELIVPAGITPEARLRLENSGYEVNETDDLEALPEGHGLRLIRWR